MCSIWAKHLIDMVLKVVKILFVSLIFGAIDIACGIHTEMDVEMRFVLMYASDDLIFARIIQNTFFGYFLYFLNGNAFIRSETQHCVPQTDTFVIVVYVGYSLHSLCGA